MSNHLLKYCFNALIVVLAELIDWLIGRLMAFSYKEWKNHGIFETPSVLLENNMQEPSSLFKLLSLVPCMIDVHQWLIKRLIDWLIDWFIGISVKWLALSDLFESPTDLPEPPSDLLELPNDLPEPPTDLPEPLSHLPEPLSDLHELPSDLSQTPSDPAQTPNNLTEAPDDLPRPPVTSLRTQVTPLGHF